MANTSSRTLRLLSLLQRQRYWPGTQLAERLEVSVRTLRRDIGRLRELGYPVQANRGLDGGYQLAAGTALPPLVLDDEEAVALAVGLQAATQGMIAGIEEFSARALTKVVQVMPPRLRQRVDALRAMTVPATWGSAGSTIDPDTLTALAQTCRDSERVQFDYTARGGEATARHAEPHRLVSLSRRWYLVAYDLTRHDWRSFRLDRMESPRNTGVRFRPRELPGDDAAAFVRAGIDNLPTAYSIEALVDAPAAVVRGHVGHWCTVTDVGNERCLLRMTSDSLYWPTMALSAVGVSFEVLSPPELLDYIHDLGDRLSRVTAPRTASDRDIPS